MAQKLRTPFVLETTFRVFTLTEQIGQGGAGRVFGGTNDEGAPVAVKILNASTAERRRRFQNELGFLQRSTHPNLVRVTDHGVSKAQGYEGPFFVMPRHDGSLRDLPRDPGRALGLIGQLLDGVEAAHLSGVVHRDLKPENVLTSRLAGGAIQLALADFGIARFLPEDQVAVVATSVADRMANFQYAAPEQRQRGREVDSRADIFALGLMVNELFTGELLQGTGFKTIGSVAAEFAYLDPIVEWMTQQNPDARPENIEAIKKRVRLEERQLLLSRQALDAQRQVVPADATAANRYVVNPVRIVDADWDANMLTLTLDPTPDVGWIHSFQSLGNYTSVLGAGPRDYRFSAGKAMVRVDGQSVPDAVRHFKDWMPQVAQIYKMRIEQSQAEESRQEQARAAAERRSIEERRAVLSRLKF